MMISSINLQCCNTAHVYLKQQLFLLAVSVVYIIIKFGHVFKLMACCGFTCGTFYWLQLVHV